MTVYIYALISTKSHRIDSLASIDSSKSLNLREKDILLFSRYGRFRRTFNTLKPASVKRWTSCLFNSGV